MNWLASVEWGARRTRCAVLSGLLTVAAVGGAVLPVMAAAPPGLTGATISSIAVSPVYVRTGLVVVEGVLLNCHASCNRVWVSHDGGVTWRVAAAQNYQAGTPLTVAVDGRGNETILAPNGSGGGFQSSADAGETWTSSSVKGRPTAAPSYAQDGAVAVAGGSVDVLVSSGGQRTVPGSSGSYADGNFAYMPGFPSTGGRSPAMLGAVDPHTAAPFVLQCDAGLGCRHPVALAGGSTYSGVPEIIPAPDYTASGTVFAETATGVYRSTDGAGSFAPLAVDQGPSGATNAYTGFGLAPGYQQGGPGHTAFVGVIQAPSASSTQKANGGGVFRSDDGGSSWKAIATGTLLAKGVQALTVAPDGRVFAAYFADGQAGLLCTDDSQTWATTCSPRGGATVAGSGGPGASPSSAAPKGGGQAPGASPSTPTAASRSTDPGTAAGQDPGGTAAGAGGHQGPPGSRAGWLLGLGFVALVVIAGAVAAVRLRRRRRAA